MREREGGRERARERDYLLLPRDLVLDVELNSFFVHLLAEEPHCVFGPVFIVGWNNTGKEVLLGLGGGAVWGRPRNFKAKINKINSKI